MGLVAFVCVFLKRVSLMFGVPRLLGLAGRLWSSPGDRHNYLLSEQHLSERFVNDSEFKNPGFLRNLREKKKLAVHESGAQRRRGKELINYIFLCGLLA